MMAYLVPVFFRLLAKVLILLDARRYATLDSSATFACFMGPQYRLYDSFQHYSLPSLVNCIITLGDILSKKKTPPLFFIFYFFSGIISQLHTILYETFDIERV